MTCSSHIVECLWNISKQPEVYASHEQSDRPVKSTLVFDKSDHFNSDILNYPQWWKIDFKIPVFVTGYLIRAESSVSTTSGWLYN